MALKPLKKLQLQGFNNLTKTLSFNIYDICYARTANHRREYIQYIDEMYNAERLTQILEQVSNIIGANILNIARQDYDPQGASVTMLISEDEIASHMPPTAEEPGPLPEGVDPAERLLKSDAVVGHLDKSHITVHTYPESHPDNGISTFRADIDVSTCGRISPLKALNYLIHSFDSDIVTIDYRVRGFTRDVHGKKVFIDHKINSIQNYIAKDTRHLYQLLDVNVYQENIFHTKMLLKEFDLNNYLFGTGVDNLEPGEKKTIRKRLRREMLEIYYGRRLRKGAAT
ncbi:MAG: adenosylmethionine decarboxylase [Myxococcota bacterium]|jgi:S-adenosylmethionine decarboxylase